jgi:uncharacterized protein (UPF0335 family)
MNQLLNQVPGWLQCFCGVIIMIFASFLILMLREVRAVLKARAHLLTLLDAVPPPNHNDRRNGLALEHLDRLRQTCSSLDGNEQRWWNRIEPNIQPYSPASGREGWFAVAAFREVLSEQDMEVGYHDGLYQSVPGVITGLGLLGTFSALLIGLLHLKYTDAVILGLNELINNLSGKFLSSVVALVLSLIFLLIERIFCERSLTRTYDQMGSKFEEIFPRLSSTRVLIDIQQLQVQQATSLGNISSDFVDRFVGIFKADLSPMLAAGVSHEMARELQTEFRPTLEQMSETLMQVKETIERLESNKQESVVGELHGLIEALQTSITGALAEMGAHFHEQLTGAAQNEFGNVQSTLSGTAKMLQDMNVQFQSMQVALGLVIEEAKRSTDSQLTSGREQVEALTRLMEGLMTRLNESTDTGLKNVSATLTVVVDDLAKKVSAVSTEMLKAASDNTTRTQDAAHQVIQTAGAWSEATAKRLEKLVGAIELRSNDVNAAGATLIRSNDALKDTLLQNQNALDSLFKASEQVRMYSTSLAGLAKNADEIQKGQIMATTQVKQVVEEFRRVSVVNSGFLEEYKKVFTEYKGVFDGVDSRIAATLTAINQGMNTYVQSVENNFRAIVSVTNQQLPQISMTLKDRITELEIQLDELSDIFDKGLKGLRSEAIR